MSKLFYICPELKNKNMKKIIIIGAYVLTVLMFDACTKAKDGAPGAQGPQGNANVGYAIYNVAASDWGLTSPIYHVTLNAPQVTQDILNKGAVLVYANVSGSSVQLPYTYYPTATYSETWQPTFTLGQVEISITDSDLTNPAAPGAYTFKVVVIAASGLIAHPHVNWKNYSEVKTTFNLPD